MKKLQFLVAGLAFFALTFSSCSSDDDDLAFEPHSTEDFEDGILILNEGSFGGGNASLSFLDEGGVVQNNVYQSVNGSLLGDTGQSMHAEDDRIFIVLNGSGTVEVANRYTLERIGTISSGLSNPRYFLIENGKGFVSNWGDPADPSDDFVAVINLNNYSVETTIPVAEGPEKMVSENGKVYVAHAGGWNQGNSVSVINAFTNTVSQTIEVGDVPDSMVEENGKLYVLSSGIPAWTGNETGGSLHVVDLSTDLLIFSSQLGNSSHPMHLSYSNNRFYYTMNSEIYSFDPASPELSDSPLFSVSEPNVIYGFSVKDQRIYITDAVDFASNGKLWIYDVTGNLLSDHSMGLLPRDFVFND